MFLLPEKPGKLGSEIPFKGREPQRPGSVGGRPGAVAGHGQWLSQCWPVLMPAAWHGRPAPLERTGASGQNHRHEACVVRVLRTCHGHLTLTPSSPPGPSPQPQQRPGDPQGTLTDPRTKNPAARPWSRPPTEGASVGTGGRVPATRQEPARDGTARDEPRPPHPTPTPVEGRPWPLCQRARAGTRGQSDRCLTRERRRADSDSGTDLGVIYQGVCGMPGHENPQGKHQRLSPERC